MLEAIETPYDRYLLALYCTHNVTFPIFKIINRSYFNLTDEWNKVAALLKAVGTEDIKTLVLESINSLYTPYFN